MFFKGCGESLLLEASRLQISPWVNVLEHMEILPYDNDKYEL
jgi:hypothetical protein